MLRALVLVSLLTPVAVGTGDTEQEQPIMLDQGDVLCIGYDRETHSCLMKQLVSSGGAETVTVLEEIELTNFGTPLKLTTLWTNRRKGARYCLVPDTVRAVVVPEIHHAAILLSAATVQGLNRYAQAQYCVEHRPCGDQHVAIAYAGTTRFAEEDTLYTLFRGDDPGREGLNTRQIDIAELDEVKGFAPVSCLPGE